MSGSEGGGENGRLISLLLLMVLGSEAAQRRSAYVSMIPAAECCRVRIRVLWRFSLYFPVPHTLSVVFALQPVFI